MFSEKISDFHFLFLPCVSSVSEISEQFGATSNTAQWDKRQVVSLFSNTNIREIIDWFSPYHMV